MNTLANDYLSTAIRRLRYYKDLGEKAIGQLNEEQIHYAPNETMNSVAVIIQHMAGNMLSRWSNFLTEDGEKEWRDRDGEFEEKGAGKEQLMGLWEKGWNCFISAIEPLKEEDLLKTIYIRQEPLTVVDAINRQLAHYPYHIGQIIMMGKLIKSENWKNLSIPKGHSAAYNASQDIKDPARKY